MKTRSSVISKSLIVLIVLIGKALQYNLDEECGLSSIRPGIESLIAHGKMIQSEQWPWIAALYFGPLFICGGTIGRYEN